ncbi:MAG: peptidylprolyl isomerase [Melioribacteraceae bacterium]|nr:peptidylprolyl isomerase [Melioribacteraceae bacterium]
MKKYVLLLTLIVFIISCSKNYKTVNLNDEIKTGKSLEEIIKIKENEHLVAVIETDFGNIEIELFPNETPKTVQNFVGLSLEGYYNGLTFHRIVKGFVIQGGDSTGTGMSGKSIYGLPFEDEFTKKLRHDSPGIVSMANRGPNTNTSQFFITLSALPDLDGRHTVFGKVIEGLDVVNKISMQPTNENAYPLNKIFMNKVIIEKRIY